MGFGQPWVWFALSALAVLAALLAFLCPGAGAYCVPGEAGGLTVSGEAISYSGPPVAVIGIGATATSTTDDSLLEVRLELGGSGFSPEDLAPLSTDGGSSGVAVFRDDGSSEDALDSSDTPIALSDCLWKDRTAFLIMDKGAESVPGAVSGRYQWLVAIRANSTISDGDQVAATLPSGSVLFSDTSTMPENSVWACNLTADSSPPGGWSGFSPADWTRLSRTPDISIAVQDTVSGLQTATAAYQYSTDGGGTWSDWLPASVTGANGSISGETVSALSVQFCQDSMDGNLVRFRVSDRAGNTGESDPCVVQIDTVAPGEWSGFGPSGWFGSSQAPLVIVNVRDGTSGLATASARFQYSTDGGGSWSAWKVADVTGNDGMVDAQTISGENVPFGQDSADRNLVRFRIEDLAGNSATSGPYTVRIDTAGPTGWRGLDPAGWTTSTRFPTVSVQVDDVTSGLAPGAAFFRYSTDQGLHWSAWAAATFSEDGRLVAEMVPFGQDSADQNLVRFRAADLAGNSAESQDLVIRIDTTGPGEWGGLEPSGWYNELTCPALTIRVRDRTAGLAPGTAAFRLSSDGGTVWSDWHEAVLGEETASPGSWTVIAEGVHFPKDSDLQNLIEFQILDLAGNRGRSGGRAVPTDATSPGDWVGLTPSGWTVVARAPTVTVWVQDLCSGLKAGSAGYQYSTDRGQTWSDWLPAALDAADGTTAFHNIIAGAVPFDKDSSDDNLIRFRVADLAGNEGISADYTVRVDTEAPGGWAGPAPAGWCRTTRAPTVTVSVRDGTSGLDPLSARYRYSTDGGISWSDWLVASMAGRVEATSPRNLTASDVPFGQDSAQLNMIMFRVDDLAGNAGQSQVYSIRIDTTPPGGWQALAPSGWYGFPGPMTITIKARDATSGVMAGRAEFQISFDGGSTWSAWHPAAVDGSGTGERTLTASNLRFDGLPPGDGRIRFRLGDLAGNVGTSEDYPVLIDAVPPGGWAGPFPGGWIALTGQPTVSVRVQDGLSGLDVHGAGYRYSTDGGATWSAWRPAAVSGWNGNTAVQTITATCVPFNQDSGTLNMIQFRVRDLAGNCGESSPFTILVDTVAPSSTLGALPLYLRSRMVTLVPNSTDAMPGPGPIEIWYSIDGGPLTLFQAGCWTAPLAFEAPSDGAFGFFVRARDLAGNLEPMPGTPDATVTIDTVPPAIELRASWRGAGYPARVSGIVEPGARLEINGRPVWVDGAGRFEVDIPVGGQNSTITATATDTAGNAATATMMVSAKERPLDLWLPLAAGTGLLLGTAIALSLRRLRKGRS